MGTSGAITEVVAVGALDQYLSSNASHTFWRSKYNKATNFALEAASQPLSQLRLGGEEHVTLNRTGDLVYWMYLQITLSGIEYLETGGAGLGSFVASSCLPCDSNDINMYNSSNTTNPVFDANNKLTWLKNNYGASQSANTSNTASQDCPNNATAGWVHWTNAVGQAMIDKAAIVVGGSTIDTLYSDYLYIWEELSGKPGKRLYEMVGKRYSRSQLVADSSERRTLYVPLPFWFTQASGNALPLTSLQFHGVQVQLTLRSVYDLVVVQPPNGSTSTSNQVSVAGGSTVLDNSNAVVTSQTSSGGSGQGTVSGTRLMTTYVYLDTNERNRFAVKGFEQLITQVQQATFSTTTDGNTFQMDLTFNHPVIELIWVARRQCHGTGKNWFNYSGVDGRDPIQNAELQLNGQARFDALPASYFRTVQPYQHHTNIPDSTIYCYSFALYPEDTVNPSGSCNFSRIDNVHLNVVMQSGINYNSAQTNFIVYARNWNIVRFQEGLGGLAYSS